ncbi:hypothetical protein ACP4OV_016041 [Aristida adscensionis]
MVNPARLMPLYIEYIDRHKICSASSPDLRVHSIIVAKISMGEVKPVTVKFIVTRHVEADAAHFKAVVQSLTGKDSNVAAWRSSTTAVAVEMGRHRQTVLPATKGAAAREGGFLDAVPSIEEMMSSSEIDLMI